MHTGMTERLTMLTESSLPSPMKQALLDHFRDEETDSKAGFPRTVPTAAQEEEQQTRAF